jgi:hypothetical protein
MVAPEGPEAAKARDLRPFWPSESFSEAADLLERLKK